MNINLKRTPWIITVVAFLALWTINARAAGPLSAPAVSPLPRGAFATLGLFSLHHGGELASLQLSPDGKWLVSVGVEGVVRLWDVAYGDLAKTYAGKRVHGVAWSSDSRFLAIARFDSTIEVWDMRGNPWNMPRTFQPPGKLDLLDNQPPVFSPDGKSLACACTSSSVCVWDMVSGKEQHIQLPKDSDLKVHLGFSPDSAQVVAQCGDRTVGIWNVGSGKLLRTLRHEHSRFERMQVLPSGKSVLLYRGHNHVARPAVVIDLQTGRSNLSHFGKAFITCFSQGGECAVIWAKGTYRIVNAADGKELGCVKAGKDVMMAHVSKDGKRLATGTEAGKIRLFAIQAGKVKELHAHALASGPQDKVVGVAVMPDRTIATVYKDEPVVCFWDVRGKLLRSWMPDPRFRSSVFAFSRDGKYLVGSMMYGNDTKVWASSGREPAKTLVQGTDSGGYAAFASDGSRLFLGYGAASDKAIVCEFPSGKVLKEFPHADRPAALSSCGRFVAQAESHPRRIIVPIRLDVFDLGGGATLGIDFDSAEVRALEFSPDGTVLAIEAGPSVWLVDPRTGTRWHSWKCTAWYRARMVFSPDGRTILLGGYDGTLHVYEVATGKERIGFTGHEGPILAVAVSPDGQFAVSGSGDTTALLWDLSGKLSFPRPAGWQPSPQEMRRIWADLGSANAKTGFRAMAALVAAADGPKAISASLRAAVKRDLRHIKRLIGLLDADEAEVREAAQRDLAELGDLAADLLATTLQAGPSAEEKKRLRELLQELSPFATRPLRLRLLRSIELLERLGTPSARAELQHLAEALPKGWLREQATLALKRIRERL